MQRAVVLAKRAQGRVEPNPMVGCVLVKRGRIIGEGYHHRFGGPHAEPNALAACDAAPRGATAYVTLEPCCYHGKTPPCTDALLAAGVARVVAAVRDPNPRVAGRGLARLRRAGATVELGLLHEEATALNAPFFRLTQQGRPWIILKWAQSLDGRIATHTGDSKWITDEAARRHVHRVRGRVDGILVGIETVLRDDPLLTCRAGRPKRVARRIVLDTKARLPLNSQLVRSARDAPTWVFCGESAVLRRIKRLEQAGCRVWRVREDGPDGCGSDAASRQTGIGNPRIQIANLKSQIADLESQISILKSHGSDGPAPSASSGSRFASRGRLDLAAVAQVLGQESCTNVIVEGGGTVLGAFLDAGLADEIHAYIASRLIGGAAAIGPLHGRGVAKVMDSIPLADKPFMCRLGAGWLVEARLPV